MSDTLITFTPEFKRQYKRLAKKYASLKADMQELLDELAGNPLKGTSLGKNAYKIRLSVGSKNKEKSGGVRVITYLVSADNELYLLTVFDKSEQASVSSKTLRQLIDAID